MLTILYIIITIVGFVELKSGISAQKQYNNKYRQDLKDYKANQKSTEKSVKNTLSSIKICLIIILVVIIAIISLIAGLKMHKSNEEKQLVIQNCESIAKSYGLENIDIDITESVIDCSNMSDLSYDEMFSLYESLPVSTIFSFTSNGDTYDIFPYTRSIYKNDDVVKSQLKSPSSAKFPFFI